MQATSRKRSGREARPEEGNESPHRENDEGSRPVMDDCSPHVGIMLGVSRQARLRRRHTENPPQARPAMAIA